MPDIPAPLLLELRANAALRDDTQVARFEDALAEAAALRDPDVVPALVSLLDDDSEQPEVMFSIVHTVEAFDFPSYLRALLPAVPELARTAPYWATVLHTRILNSPDARAVYADATAESPAPVRAAVRALLESIRQRKPQFATAADEVLTRVR